MQPSSSKSNKHGPSILDMFAKQFAKRKRADLEDDNQQQLQTSQDHKMDDNRLIKSEYNDISQNPRANEECLVEQFEKKMKTEDDVVTSKFQVRQINVIERCEYCRQKLDDEITFYPGHPNGAIDEDIALTDPKLCLFSGDESFIHESDEHPQNKLTYFR